MNSAKRSMRIAAGVALCIAVCMVSYADLDSTDDGLRSFIERYHRIIDRAQQGYFDNGLRTVLLRDSSLPVVNLQIWVKAGSIYEGELIGTGVSHIVEHMIFKGSEHNLPSELASKVEQFGGSINAHTGHAETVYTVSCHSRYTEEVLRLIFDSVTSPVFDSGEYTKEHAVVMNELELREDSPRTRLFQLLWEKVFLESPYAVPIGGFRDLVKGLTRDQAYEYFRRRYTPNNMVVALAGDIDIAAVNKIIKETFGALKMTTAVKDVIPREPPQLGMRTTVVKDPAVKAAYTAAAYRGPSLLQEDVAAMDLLSAVLSDGNGALLYRHFIQENPLALNIGSYSYTPLHEGLFIITSSVNPGNYEDYKEKLSRFIMDLKAGGIKEIEESLPRARWSLIKSRMDALDTVSGMCTDIASSIFYTGGLGFSSVYIKKVLSLSSNDLVAAAQRYLDPSAMTEITLMPGNGEKYEPSPAKDKPVRDLKRTVCENGARVITMRDDSLPTVGLFITFPGGALYEPEDKRGISTLCAEMMLTPVEGREDSIAVLESEGVFMRHSSGYNSTGFVITMPSAVMPLVMEKLGNLVFRPGFDKAGLNKMKMTISGRLKALYDDPFSSALYHFRKLFFGEHPYGYPLYGTQETLASLTLGDIKKWHAGIFVPDRCVITVVGDIDHEKAIRSICDMLGTEAVTGTPQVSAYPFDKVLRKNAPAAEKVQQPVNQDILFVGFPAEPVTHPDRYVFDLLEAVFTGQSSPLFMEIREKKGASYSTGAFYLRGVIDGGFVFYVTGREASIAESRAVIIDRIAKLRDGLITEKDIERAKAKCITGNIFGLQSRDGMAMEIGLDELYGLGYDAFETYEKGIMGVAKEDIVNVARQYFTDDQRYEFMLTSQEEKE